MNTTTTPLAANLRDAADWLDAHPDLPPVYSLSAYSSVSHDVQITFNVATDAEADALLALTDDDYWRSDHRYEESKSGAARIATGRLGSDHMTLSVAVTR